MAPSNQSLNTFLDFAMYHKLYPVSAENFRSLEMNGLSTAWRRYAHFYHLSVSIDCASVWGEINLSSLLSSINELESEYSHENSSDKWSDLKRSIVYQMLLNVLRDVIDGLDKCLPDTLAAARYTSQIENLLEEYKPYYKDHGTSSLHVTYNQHCERLLNEMMDQNGPNNSHNTGVLNYERARLLLDKHPLHAFKSQVVEFLRSVEEKVLPIPKGLIGEYEHPEVIHNYSDNKVTLLTGTSNNMRKKRRVDQLAAGASTDANADCDAKAGAGAAPLAEPSSVSYTDCSIHSESYKEMIQQNLKWAEMRKERLQLIESYKEGAPAIHFLPMFTSTGKLSQDNATMMELMPRFVEMRRRRERGEPDWSFNQEGYDRYVKQAREQAEHEKANHEKLQAVLRMLEANDEEEDGDEVNEDAIESKEDGGVVNDDVNGRTASNNMRDPLYQTVRWHAQRATVATCDVEKMLRF